MVITNIFGINLIRGISHFIIENLKSYEKKINNNIITSVTKDTTKSFDNHLICGVWCPAWGDCEFITPGNICIVKELV